MLQAISHYRPLAWNSSQRCYSDILHFKPLEKEENCINERGLRYHTPSWKTKEKADGRGGGGHENKIKKGEGEDEDDDDEAKGSLLLLLSEEEWVTSVRRLTQGGYGPPYSLPIRAALEPSLLLMQEEVAVVVPFAGTEERR